MDAAQRVHRPITGVDVERDSAPPPCPEIATAQERVLDRGDEPPLIVARVRPLPLDADAHLRVEAERNDERRLDDIPRLLDPVEIVVGNVRGVVALPVVVEHLDTRGAQVESPEVRRVLGVKLALDVRADRLRAGGVAESCTDLGGERRAAEPIRTYARTRRRRTGPDRCSLRPRVPGATSCPTHAEGIGWCRCRPHSW